MGEFAIFSLNTGIMAVGEGDYGRASRTSRARASASVTARVDVFAARDRARHTTTTDTSDATLTTLRIGHTLPAGSSVASVVLDGQPVDDFEQRETNRGLEVRVEATPGERHTPGGHRGMRNSPPGAPKAARRVGGRPGG